jgi:hypothetical protein
MDPPICPERFLTLFEACHHFPRSVEHCEDAVYDGRFTFGV